MRNHKLHSSSNNNNRGSVASVAQNEALNVSPAQLIAAANRWVKWKCPIRCESASEPAAR